MPARALPPRPSLAQLKIQAGELRRDHRRASRPAAARIAAHHPARKGRPIQAVLDEPLTLADAQLVIAREYGFATWARLKHHVETADRLAAFGPHPGFEAAIAAIDGGDLAGLSRLIAADPALVHARTNLEPPYHYFTGATLLHHVAANPDRGRLSGALGPLPATIAEVARLLLDAGADVHAATLGPKPCTTMDLVLTSKQASDAGASGPLIDVLLRYGARLAVTKPGALDASLANHAPRAAEKLIELGARPDLIALAALGRIDGLRAAFDEGGRLRSPPRRGGSTMTERDAVGLALLHAYVLDQREAVELLITKDANLGATGVGNGTILHRAAWAGDLATVERLVALGADVNDRNNPFAATPMGWACFNNQDHVVAWMQRNASVDLYDAVAFDLPDQAEARLRESPASVDELFADAETARGAPLHLAARLGREAMARLLLEHGADPDVIAGNGETALDLAEASHAESVAELLRRRGGARAADL